MNVRFGLAILGVLLLLAGDAPGASEAVYGLELVKFDQVFDPSARPERLMLVSGALKLTGGFPKGNKWEMVTYIPRMTAAPRSDYGVFFVVGDRIYLYSLVTFASYLGTVKDGGERIEIEKVNSYGQSQTESWYLER